MHWRKLNPHEYPDGVTSSVLGIGVVLAVIGGYALGTDVHNFKGAFRVLTQTIVSIEAFSVWCVGAAFLVISAGLLYAWFTGVRIVAALNAASILMLFMTALSLIATFEHVDTTIVGTTLWAGMTWWANSTQRAVRQWQRIRTRAKGAE